MRLTSLLPLICLAFPACNKPEAAKPAPPPVSSAPSAAPSPPPAPPQPPLSHQLGLSGHPTDLHTLAIGDPAPDFSLPGIDGRNYSLKDFASADVLMVLFTSNHCPTSHAMEQRLKKLRGDLRGQSFALVAINPNNPEGISPNELGYGEFTDSFADMKPYAASLGWDFPYLYDGQEQRTARAYGCLATPHVFVFDKARRLRYAGRFDDSYYADAASVKSPDARNAVEALLAGKEVAVPLTRPMGCSTKWREKKARVEAQVAAWAKLPVVVEKIDAKGVAALRANKSANYRLINVWATWCAPCAAEFPDLVSLSRQFDMRDFEVVTLSVDEANSEAKVVDFLKKQNAGVSQPGLARAKADGRQTNHYLYAGPGQDALAAALDPKWPGPIPYTLLVAPGGEIVWRHSGEMAREKACAEIVKALKPYYTP